MSMTFPMAPVYRGGSSEDQVARATIRVHRGPLSKFSIQSYVTTGLPGVVAWRASASLAAAVSALML